MNAGDHVIARLAGYRDGELSGSDARVVESHLARCPRCRAAGRDIARGAALLDQLRPVQPPHDMWAAIEAALPAPSRPRGRLALPRPALAWVASAAAVALAAWLGMSRPWAAWTIERAGSIVRMSEGEWIDSGPSTARVIVGDIGTVDIGAGTRVRLGTSREGEYRLALARGTLSARIAAPPRVFFVETPAATVVDLGCAYTVDVDEEGTGILKVTEGWAALEWNGREALVPAGAHSRIAARVGPGTPYFEDASGALVDALVAFDFDAGERRALDTVLAEARVRDTLTLWHLLSRVGPGDRAAVYDRMTALVAPPPDLSRERVLVLDPAALRFWREELAWKW